MLCISGENKVIRIAKCDAFSSVCESIRYFRAFGCESLVTAALNNYDQLKQLHEVNSIIVNDNILGKQYEIFPADIAQS